MTKRIFAILTALLLLCTAMISASASSRGFVIDEENLFSESTVEKLDEKAQKLTSKYDCNVFIITYEDENIYSSIESVANMYLDMNPDTILLLISKSMGKYSISADGYGEEVLTESGREYIDEKISPDLKDGKFDEAAEEFLEIAEKYLDYYDANGKVYMPFRITWVITAVVIGVIIAFIAVFIMKGQLKSVRFEPAAKNYLVDGSFNLTLSRDIFLYSTVRRTAKPKSNSSSSSGGSRGHTSGSL